ncbi:hypothetical protein VitviT2T_008168 [Vitis vinifera]|uniref:Factor of DNA methylation 1-5/IDN2 domain-containing protein n=1 Tax=Vitis vinifera TaxID=29760 RepID=A0ABY9C1G3_VITVI|nr:protein INVOLVED IN DE NOVO 2-like [Vitis vinifera]WJZ88906.1 hypothetical protein VitviT2T_008168 [Vitis vinifera]
MADAEEKGTFEPVPANGDDHFPFQSWKSLSPEFTRIRKVQKRAREAWEKMLLDHDSIAAKLESRWKLLEYQAKLLKKREDQFHVEEHRWILEKERNWTQISELKRANRELLRLDEDQKRENDRLHERIMELKKEPEDKQALELEIKRMKELNETLLVKEQKSNEEQSEVRRLLITEIIDEEDEKLKALKSEYGYKVYVAVTNALTEINKYKPISRYENKELWNHREGRKATLREVVSHMLEQWRLYAQKRY